jgi:hypothetical protein
MFIIFYMHYLHKNIYYNEVLRKLYVNLSKSSFEAEQIIY